MKNISCFKQEKSLNSKQIGREKRCVFILHNDFFCLFNEEVEFFSTLKHAAYPKLRVLYIQPENFQDFSPGAGGIGAFSSLGTSTCDSDEGGAGSLGDDPNMVREEENELDGASDDSCGGSILVSTSVDNPSCGSFRGFLVGGGDGFGFLGAEGDAS